MGGGFGSFSRVERLNSEFYKVYSVPVSGGDQRQKTAIGPFCDTLTWHWTWFDGTRFEVFFKNQDRVSLFNFFTDIQTYFCSALCKGFTASLVPVLKQREAIKHCLLS